MDTDAAVPWVPVASFLGPYAEVEADLLVAHLQGSAIPVLRMPMFFPISLLYDTGMPGTFPIRVYVPPDHAESAKELADEQEPQSIPRPVRAAAQWYLGSAMITMVGGGALTLLDRSEWLGRGTWALALGCAIGLLWRGLELVAWLRRERPLLIRWQPVLVAGLVWIVLCAVGGLISWAVSSLPHFLPMDVANGWLIVLTLTLIVLLIAVLRKRDQAPPEDFDE